MVFFFTVEGNYIIGTEAEVERHLLNEIRHFFLSGTDEEIRASDIYRERKSNMKCIDDVDFLEKQGIEVFKAFLFSADPEELLKVKPMFQTIPTIASASSFETNIELTDIRAQQGPVLKALIEERGHTMDEVMVLGDSLNDLSMMIMDFGATVAVENAVEEVRTAAKYITKSNDEDGVAYAIEKVLAGRLSDLAKK